MAATPLPFNVHVGCLHTADETKNINTQLQYPMLTWMPLYLAVA